MIPRQSKLAQELRKTYFALRKKYGGSQELPIYREGNLYNIYLRQIGKPEKLDALELNAKTKGSDKEFEKYLAGKDPAVSSQQLFTRPARGRAPQL